jgi:hypothetical protein
LAFQCTLQSSSHLAPQASKMPPKAAVTNKGINWNLGEV